MKEAIEMGDLVRLHREELEIFPNGSDLLMLVEPSSWDPNRAVVRIGKYVYNTSNIMLVMVSKAVK